METLPKALAVSPEILLRIVRQMQRQAKRGFAFYGHGAKAALISIHDV